MINTRANSDLANTAVLAVPVLIVSYLVYRWFGFEFILGNGPLLIGVGLFILALRLRYWWPAAFLLVQVSFQPFIISHLGLWGNFLTVAAVAAFLSRQSPGNLPRALLGTSTQRLMALFLVGTLLSMLWADQDFSTWLDLFQKITLFFVVAVVVDGFGRGARITTLAWLAIGSITVLYLLSELEFYLGGFPLPGLTDTSALGLSGSAEASDAVTARLYAVGALYTPNRFAFLSILPISLAIGVIVAHRIRPIALLAAAACLVMGFGILLSGSRAATLGALASTGTILLVIGHGQKRLRLGGFAIAAVLAALGILQFLPTGLTAYDRLIGAVPEWTQSAGVEVDEERRDFWRLGLTLFQENPISGVGLRRFGAESVTRLGYERRGDPHSAYVQVLAETGLLGTVPFAVLLGYVGWILLRNRKTLPMHLIVWKAAFAGAFFGMLVYSIFGTAQYARFFWIPVAFAALLELQERRDADQNKAVSPRGVSSAQSEWTGRKA